MKKLFTFFAVMFALLGSAIPAHAWDFSGTIYVDIANTNWSSAPYFNIGHDSYRISYLMSKVAGHETLYQYTHSGTWGGYGKWSITQNAISTSGENQGLASSDYYSASQIPSSTTYVVLKSGSGMEYVDTTKPPYIRTSTGNVKMTYADGGKWKWNVETASTINFRILKNSSTKSLTETENNNALVPDGQDSGATQTLRTGVTYTMYVYGNFSGALQLNSGNWTVTLSSYDPSASSGAKLEVTANGPVKPAAPTLPAAATGNKVTIDPVSNATVYYTTNSDLASSPSTETWTRYTGAIDLTAASVTIYAAAVGSDGTWSEVAHQSYTYGMPVPTITIANDGTVTISVSSTVEGAKLMYGFSSSAINQEYQAPFTAEAGQTVYAQYVSTVFGNSTVQSATYAGARSVTKIELYTRDNTSTAKGTATAASADGTWKLGSVDIPGSADKTYWNSTMSVKVYYSDETSAWYSTSASDNVHTINADTWYDAHKRTSWPLTTNDNFGFFVADSKGKTVTVYTRFVGDEMQIKATMPKNSLTIGSSAPQITGYGLPQEGWNNYQDFTKVSDSPKSYEYVFTCGNPNDNQEYVWYGLKINGTTYRPANLSLGESTYTFTQGTPGGNNQATIKGLTTGVDYALTLTETDEGLLLSVMEAGIPKPVFVRNAKENVVTINVPAGCTLHYSVNDGTEVTATSTVNLTIPTDGLTVSAYFTKEGEEGQGDTVSQTFAYYTAPQRWASKEWSLSDDAIMPKGSVKYFYMSRFQNDDRVSPEWELVKSGNTYTLDYFMCIPAGEFRLRRIAKDNNGNLSYRDFGLDTYERITPTSIGATSSTVGTADDPEIVSKNYTVYGGTYGNKARGYAWDLGYSMVSVKITDTTDGSNATGPNELSVTLSVDFSKPSTANVAPIKGMPYVALTGSKLQIPTIEGQNIKHAVDLPDGYSNAFTNAWIQYDAESNMLMYGKDVTETNTLYHSDTNCKPDAGAVMNSTIMPPRNPIWFKLVDADGNESNVTSDKTILKYKGKETRKFTTENGRSTKDNVTFAVYALNDMEMSGLFKIYSGYSGRYYGSTENGLSLFSNWGVGHQGSTEPYASSTIPSGQAMPLNGGGPRTNADGTAKREAKNDTNGNYDDEDNYAGRYFEFNKRTYVSELNFYYALEPDTDPINNSNLLVNGQGQDKNYNSHHADDITWTISNPTNDGRNFSWFRFVYEGSIGKITLDKTGVDSGRVKWSINEDNSGQDVINSYRVVFYQVDPVTGNPIGEEIEIVNVDCPDYTTVIPKATNDRTNLQPGWYEAKLYYNVDTMDEDGTTELKGVNKEAVSSRILIFQMAASAITAKQRVTTADDGVRVYHPVIDVTPDATSSIQALDSSTEVTSVFADITIDGISDNDVCRIQDMAGNDFPISANGTEAYVTYDRANRKATVHYPEGFFTSRTNIPDMRFAVRNAAIDENTDFSMTIDSSEGSPATSTTNALVYMPAGKLYGKLIAQAVNSDVNSSVSFNALAVTNQDELPEGEIADGYARIRYVDMYNHDEPCYIGTMDGTSVMAKVTYVATDDAGTETPKPLFAGEKLNMLFNPDADGIYTSKRLKIAGIPYKTDTATDAAGEEISVRKDQEAIFDVQLTYSIEGYDDFNSRVQRTALDYNAAELTSPRNGLADLKTKLDEREAITADGKAFATDVTAITESFVENYGGLFTNIEDAHVALQAVDPNEALVHDKSFDKWYMDHGDKWENATGAGAVNPHNPAAHRALGNTKRDGAGEYTSVNEVHPLLRGKNALTGSDGKGNPNGFRNDSEVNNAWWNERALVAPEFHVADHIKGDFIRDDNGNITGWTSESAIQKPAQHSEYWAGVKAGNDDAYKLFDGSTVIQIEDLQSGKKKDVDIRDPQHSYYGMNSHFSSTPGLRTAFHLGEMPLNANDIVAFFGDGSNTEAANNHQNAVYLGGDFETLKSVALRIHNEMSEKIAKANYSNEGRASVTIDGENYTLDIPVETPWNIDNIWAARAALAFKSSATLGGKSPAEAIFEAANNHMIFKVRHVNHESWFVPGGGLQHDLKTRPLWAAFQGVNVGGKTIDNCATDKEKEHFVMSNLRMSLDDYCPLAYDVRYTYPFLTTEKVTAENYDNSKVNARKRVNARAGEDDADDPTANFERINNMLAAVTSADVTNVAARDTGRVPFFDGMTTSPDEVVPTAISDVNDDIRGAGFTIVYNRAAGTVTITADGDRQLKDAAVYDATGASLVMGTSADRVNDQTIVLDVRNIARGAYVVSTNLGGAKFMK